MKLLKNPQFQFIFFLLVFFVINLLQGHFTALFEDEAYYWVWSENLAFGYFDHPPMVALWIKFSNLFFEGELSLRFLSTLGFSIMIWLIWLMIDFQHKWEHVKLFYMLIIAMAFLQIFGFIITPDTPLLFFIALFLFAYKRFLEKPTLVAVLFLGFTMATMLYSKYHGILVILFVILSNLKLLKNTKFWLAGGIGLALFVPHLMWQFDNGFPSFVYHLKERGKKPYSILNTLTHLLNMIAVVGITFPIIYKAFYKQKIKNQFERSLKFLVYGFFVFFFLMSFASQPQAQWLVAILIPLILITFPYFIETHGDRKWLVILVGVQLFLILVIRAFLAFPEISPLTLEPHVAQQWVPELQKKTNSKPIVFVNSYRNASVYQYYTGIKTHSYSVLRGRMSQYNLLDFEANMQGEDLFSASTFIKDQSVLAQKGSSYIYGKPIFNYITFEKINCIIDKDEISFKTGQNTFQFRFVNTYSKNINFEQVRFIGVFQGYKNKILAKVPLEVLGLNPMGAGEEIEMEAVFTSPEIEKNEKITFRVALEFYDLLEGFQGNKVAVKFE